ncbi:MAG: IS66 family insertion sequence element accessory protein TnpB [Flavobacteriaceae bacterium]|nr:IS66 family insertion sequence element accessory protein TnpB [Flavobacteriaceae bacterium]
MLFGISGKARLFLYSAPADMRQGFDGLSGLVNNKLNQDPLSGDIFIFINRTRTLIKLLVWDQSGFAIWHKRLEQGTFEMPSIDSGNQSVEISRRKLMLILEGISLKSVKERKRFSI